MNTVLKKHKGYEEDIGRDRLSELPDEVLVRILSFLPTLDAVRTVLLRIFGKLWTLVHTLDFRDSQFRQTFDENEMLSERYSALVWWFSHFVRDLLMLHRRPTIEKFLLTTTNETNTEAVTTIAEVEMWIRFALSREAKLTVKFDCPNLRILDITMDFDDVEVVDLSSIHELIINTSDCDAHKFRKLLDGCQSAQVLTLTKGTIQLLTDILKEGVAFPKNRWRRVVLTVSSNPSCIIFICDLVSNSPCLKELVIDGSVCSSTHRNVVSQEVSSPRVAPHLKIVTMRGYWKNYRSRLQLVELSSSVLSTWINW